MKVCGRPGNNITTHCVEPWGHDGYHTYAPVPDAEYEKMSDRLEEVMRILTQTCPDWQVGDFKTPRPKCCLFHDAANTVIEAQTILRMLRQ